VEELKETYGVVARVWRGWPPRYPNSMPLVSNSMRDCCDEQKKCCRNIQEEVIRVKVLINSVHSKVQSSNSRLNMVSTGTLAHLPFDG
jgi:hypothetical protein